MIEIVYNNEMQPQTKAVISLYLQKYKWLIPKWCQVLNVACWDASNDGVMATMKSDYAYRSAELCIYSQWLDRSEREQESTIVHELLHIHLAVMADFSRHTINHLCNENEAPKFNAHLQEQLAIYHESITQDLAYCLLNNVKG